MSNASAHSNTSPSPAGYTPEIRSHAKTIVIVWLAFYAIAVTHSMMALPLPISVAEAEVVAPASR